MGSGKVPKRDAPLHDVALTVHQEPALGHPSPPCHTRFATPSHALHQPVTRASPASRALSAILTRAVHSPVIHFLKLCHTLFAALSYGFQGHTHFTTLPIILCRPATNFPVTRSSPPCRTLFATLSCILCRPPRMHATGMLIHTLQRCCRTAHPGDSDTIVAGLSCLLHSLQHTFDAGDAGNA